MYEILLIAFLVISLAIICLVLVQHGKGADMGASFGAGASATLFGSAGTGNFLTRSTSILGLLFFVISLVLANLGSLSTSSSRGDFDNIEDNVPVEQVVTPEQPATNPALDIPD
ncbi:preprotein translocase subunit SecG [Zophobihabitans entericus]|uniref:Protein-export membrane protein SecG n=1 Tax=Zophobihabitans entericus TaxID=1635327 RepID=A0A6G9IDF0_9GAMM|nr:preprotein translocase subunit SecG [Zophobihabitans entericus]QIQ22253.1 preprotein translocase subunit SecG [Zophobihabitans entericus]